MPVYDTLVIVCLMMKWAHVIAEHNTFVPFGYSFVAPTVYHNQTVFVATTMNEVDLEFQKK